ncbi:insulinase family protein [Bacillus aquiflavi]|uniref:Insulinase family protein n=1 Tax=Bacillus aquiflavi TaxID=2672567 RepID=A0A6B3VY16_9BACI|nr:pitrilysin family protein [Bacillus aquiflavi]MBA4536255.1 insulinase family protein [Bacillus aquiflavi]NEY80623.1 insulinase family protein [Bacillus aquiflavi]UAC49435.1 insulinase family protein [Bacillus aquiflavi]
MAVINESVTEMNGYRLHVVPTKKYKTNTLIWKMKAPLDQENVTKRALLPYVLQSSSAKYSTTTKLRAYLDDLYGALFFVDVAKKGEHHIISFSIEIANEIFLKDKTPLLRKAFEFLAEVLTKPNAKKKAFDQETVNKEKRTLKQRIQSINDDKIRYSNFRLIEEMCNGESYALNVNGRIEDIDHINEVSLYEYFEKAFSEDEMDLYVVGDVDENEVKVLTNELLQFKPRTVKESNKQMIKRRAEVQEVKEVQDVKQGKLHIGYRTNILYGDQQYFHLQVFNGIFGGFSHSKLFINVREKASLAYYATSRIESHKGLLMVMSGIDIKNYHQAVTIIREQMEAMRNGDFTDDEISQTKAVIKNQMLETIDIVRGIVEVFYHNVVSKSSLNLDDWLKEINSVTREEIVNVAKKIDLDTIYFLTGTEAGE